jgi:hypothetical protein
VESATDGQHRHGGKKHLCFCCKNARHCEVFVLAKKAYHPPEYKALYKQGFVICPECIEKGNDYLEAAFKRWAEVQAELTSYGVGLQELERHKITGELPLLNRKRKNEMLRPRRVRPYAS